MSRIRSIHPGLFSDESFMALTIDHPLCIPLLIGLWTEADDDGVFEWKPLTIKAKVLPAAHVDVPAMLDVLISLNFIMRYEVAGKIYGAIRNFKTWQRPKQPKVKYPKDPTASAYVGISGEALPHDLPSDGEMSPQREEVGGKREDEKESPPVAPDGGEAGDLIDKALKAFPRSPHFNEAKFERGFRRLPADQQALFVAAAQHYGQWFSEEQVRRKRSMAEALQFAPPLDKWLSEGAWRSVSALPLNGSQPAIPMTKLDRERDAELWLACEKVMGKPAPTSGFEWSFRDEIIAQARQQVAA